MKTAVEWLVERLQKEYKWFPSTQSELIKEALEMEKQQIIDAVEWGNRRGYDEHTLTCINDDDVRYYNETFKSK